MFSFGVVVVQLLLGKVGIFTENAKSFKEVKEATQKRLPPLELMPAEFPSLQWLAEHLLAKDSRDRPTASSLLSEPWGERDEAVTKDRNLKRRHTVHEKEDAVDNAEDAVEGKESDRKLVRRNTTNLNLAGKAPCEVRPPDVKALPTLLARIGATSGSLLAPVKLARGGSLAAPTSSKLLPRGGSLAAPTASKVLRSSSMVAPTSSCRYPGTAFAMANPYSPAKRALPLQQCIIGAQLVR
jgi:serine/threonine protein kinase